MSPTLITILGIAAVVAVVTAALMARNVGYRQGWSDYERAIIEAHEEACEQQLESSRGAISTGGGNSTFPP